MNTPAPTSPSAARAAGHPIVSREAWLEARRQLLEKEKAFTRQRDELAAERRRLPWTEVTKNYLFDTPKGRQSLAQLFGPRSQLFVYHFMFGPDWEEGCPSCSLLADGFDGVRVHLEQRDVALVAASRAPLEKLHAFQRRMGWSFPWVSSGGSEFNRDFGVSFNPEEMERGEMFYNYRQGSYPREEAHGASVFYREGDTVYHTYSCYARGCEALMPVYDFLDLVPKGRDEDNLEWSMAWVRHHDRYEGDGSTGCGQHTNAKP